MTSGDHSTPVTSAITITTTEPPPADVEPVGDDGPELLGDVTLSEVVSPGRRLPRRDVDGVVAHTIRDNEQWWSEIFVDLYGGDYRPIEGGFYPGYPDRDDPIPGCPGPEPMTMTEIASYLALYCHSGDFFAYDDRDDGTLADLIGRYGSVVIAAIFSHEWAHAIQTRAGIDLDDTPTILTEQQADCFAGAWAQRSALDQSNWIRLDDDDIDSIVRFYGETADPADNDPRGANGHGSYLDRLGAFGAGFGSGPARCVDLIDQPLTLLADVAPRGDESPARVACTGPECVDALNQYWGGASIEIVASSDVQPGRCSTRVDLPGNLAACPTERLVLYDTGRDQPNDMVAGSGVFLANAWALLNSVPIDTSPVGQARRWCLVGEWVRNANGTQGAADTSTTSDIDAGLRAILGSTDDMPLLVAATAYRRGVIDGTC